jgi:hypothetical protein
MVSELEQDERGHVSAVCCYAVHSPSHPLTFPSIEVIKDEFTKIPVEYIKEVQKDKKHLYTIKTWPGKTHQDDVSQWIQLVFRKYCAFV